MRTVYVAGFLLDPTLSKVVLVRKNHPAWQAGRLNGVGGSIEPGETSAQAMTREFEEEASVRINDWNKYLTLDCGEADVVFFWAIGNVHAVVSRTPEKVEVYDVSDVMNRCDTISNVRWLIQMARSFSFGEKSVSFFAKSDI